MQLSYQGGFSLVKPYGGEEGSGYGHGDGRAEGPRLAGAVQWANHPRRRSDGRMLPNAGGLVTTQDGAKVTFHAGADGLRPERERGARRRTEHRDVVRGR